MQVEDLFIEGDTLILLLASSQSSQMCPACTHASSHVHSRYNRRLADLPCQGRAVELRLKVRRFFCENPTCIRKTFAEQFPEIAPAYARRTLRQSKTLGEIAFALGGRAGARLACFLSLPVSFWTLLRLLRRTPMAPIRAPRMLGTDDFAWRKGDHYGTILVDLQAHRPIDLLPDREAGTFERWLREHPGVEVVSRDRASSYAEGAKKGAPDAIQIADRYHLVANLRDTVQRLLDRKRQCLPPLQEGKSTALPAMTDEKPLMEPQVQQKEKDGKEGERVSLTRAEALRQMRRGKRYERYQAVAELHQQGLGERAIARTTGLSRNTVHRYLEAGSFPESGPRKKRRSKLDPYLPYLRERWDAGCQNAAQLFREIQTRGYRASSPTTLRALISDWRTSSPTPVRRTRGPKRTSSPPAQRHLSSRQASFLFIKQPETLSPTHRSYLEQMYQASEEMKQAYELSQQFVSMVRLRQGTHLDVWLQRTKEYGPRELISFASGIRRDYAAVQAGLSMVESNGQVEGQVTRLKYLKRQMYGRAKFDLLRLRVLHAA
ncbi:ISL3 family transposase [Dictyobacter formicarum]